jgi:hypothetical protein
MVRSSSFKRNTVLSSDDSAICLQKIKSPALEQLQIEKLFGLGFGVEMNLCDTRTYFS